MEMGGGLALFFDLIVCNQYKVLIRHHIFAHIQKAQQRGILMDIWIYSLTSLYNSLGIAVYVRCTGMSSLRLRVICKLGILPVSPSSRAKAPDSSNKILLHSVALMLND